MPGMSGNVYLVGFMGCGKSAVGPGVAEALGAKFEDTDCIVEASEGRTVARIFEDAGEARFRQVERRALDELSQRSGQVVATGGGLFLNRDARRRMRLTGAVVWLDADLAIIRRRVGSANERPVWNCHDPIQLRALYERRRAVYALADLRVDASMGSPSDVAARIVGRLESVFN